MRSVLVLSILLAGSALAADASCATSVPAQCSERARQTALGGSCELSCVGSTRGLKGCYFARKKCLAVARDDADQKLCNVNYEECTVDKNVKLEAFESCKSTCATAAAQRECTPEKLRADVAACEANAATALTASVAPLDAKHPQSTWDSFFSAREGAYQSLVERCKQDGLSYPNLLDRFHQACQQGSDRFDLELWPEERAITDPSASQYTFAYGCSMRCACSTEHCNWSNPAYRGVRRPGLVPANNPDTRREDIRWLTYADEPHNRFGALNKACFKLFRGDACNAACSNESGPPGLLQLGDRKQVTFVGELSGALLTFDCGVMNCDCHAQPRAMWLTGGSVPDPSVAAPSATPEQVARARAGADPTLTYLSGRGVSLP